jgi:O-antigen/teichoic acid export membrane protein
VVALSLPGIIIALALLRDGAFTFRPDMDHMRGPLGRQMASVAVYGVIIAFSNILIQYIDRIMINSYLDLEATGIYGRAFFFGTLVSIPIRAVSKISAVVVAEQWKDDDHDSINRLYRETSLHQLMFGLLIFIGIWGNIVNVFHILPDDYGEGKWVVFWIGLSNLFIMASGISGAIMTTSRYYRLLALFVVVFGALVIISNMIFIPMFGIAGAAMASAIAAFIYGLMRYVFLWIRYRMQPYTWKHLLAVLIAGASYLPALLIPDLNHEEARILWLCLDIAVRSASIAIVFIGLTFILRVSPDLNVRAAEMLRHIKIRLTLHKPE